MDNFVHRQKIKNVVCLGMQKKDIKIIVGENLKSIRLSQKRK